MKRSKAKSGPTAGVDKQWSVPPVAGFSKRAVFLFGRSQVGALRWFVLVDAAAVRVGRAA
jgi:hypothetical protein